MPVAHPGALPAITHLHGPALLAAVGEVVFNTSLTGYQEILTDPSYKGQFVCFTYPHIGNVGINPGEAGASVTTAAPRAALLSSRRLHGSGAGPSQPRR